jgi:hypothetical protein
VLDQQGGLTRNVDPRYASDPILGAQVSVSDLQLQGRQSDGRFLFSGGTLSITDQAGKFGLSASFNEYTVGNSSQPMALNNFGTLRRGETFELLDSERQSFLGDFVDDHLLRGLPTSSGLPGHTVGLSFITGPGMDLATLTNGFTTSAMFVPADIYVGGGGFEIPAGPKPGDYNGDGHIDTQDYAVWKADFGTIGSQADGNGDGIVGAADYPVWRRNVESKSLLGSTLLGNVVLGNTGRLARNAVAIPEPTMAALAIIALCLAMPAYRIPQPRSQLGEESGRPAASGWSDWLICHFARREAAVLSKELPTAELKRPRISR